MFVEKVLFGCMLLSQYVGKVGLFDDKRGKLKSAQKNLGVWKKGWKGNVSFFIIFTHIWRKDGGSFSTSPACLGKH